MSDNPFSEPDDTDRTLIRPAAGRRPASPLSDRMPERSAPPPVYQRDSDAAEPQLIGTNPLVAAAAPLLQLLARLNNKPSAAGRRPA